MAIVRLGGDMQRGAIPATIKRRASAKLRSPAFDADSARDQQIADVEVVLEVMSWPPEFAAAFTPASGGQARLDDLEVSVAAALTAHAPNVGFTPVITPGWRR